jgi:hypothetical protein
LLARRIDLGAVDTYLKSCDFQLTTPVPFAVWRLSAKLADETAPHSVDRKRVSVASEITEEQ